MSKDLLGRDIPAGELIVHMAIGRRSRGLHYAIENDNGGVITKDGSAYSGASNRHWIEFPNEKEIKIKQDIIKAREEYLEKQKAKKNIKAIPYKDLKFGHVYKMTNGWNTVFWGRCQVYEIMDNNKINFAVNLNPDNCFAYGLRGQNPEFLKGKRKLIKEIGKCTEGNSFLPGRIKELTEDYCLVNSYSGRYYAYNGIIIYREGFQHEN